MHVLGIDLDTEDTVMKKTPRLELTKNMGWFSSGIFSNYLFPLLLSQS